MYHEILHFYYVLRLTAFNTLLQYSDMKNGIHCESENQILSVLLFGKISSIYQGLKYAG